MTVFYWSSRNHWALRMQKQSNNMEIKFIYWSIQRHFDNYISYIASKGKMILNTFSVDVRLVSGLGSGTRTYWIRIRRASHYTATSVILIHNGKKRKEKKKRKKKGTCNCQQIVPDFTVTDIAHMKDAHSGEKNKFLNEISHSQHQKGRKWI